MAKKICKECLTEFDGRMKYCPSCGAPASEAMDIVEEPQTAAPTAQPAAGSDAEHDPERGPVKTLKRGSFAAYSRAISSVLSFDVSTPRRHSQSENG